MDATATAGDADAARVLVEEHNPDVLVVDVDPPESGDAALELVADAVRMRPRLAALVLADAADPAVVARAFEAGASAFVLKTPAPAPSLALTLATAPLRAPRRVVGCEHAAAGSAAPRLTRRELEILRLVSEGRSNRAVGRLLWVSDQTVKFHLANIYRKLGVGSRFEAAQAARERGLLQPPEDEAESDGLGAVLAVVSPPSPGTSP